MGPTLVLAAPYGPHTGLMNLVIRDVLLQGCTAYFFVSSLQTTAEERLSNVAVQKIAFRRTHHRIVFIDLAPGSSNGNCEKS